MGACMSEPWLSANNVAEHSGAMKDTAYAWVADKGLPANEVGRLFKFQASKVDAWVRRREQRRGCCVDHADHRQRLLLQLVGT
jgi:excisionase family DNA binding protein